MASLKKEVTNEEVLREVSDKGILKVCLKPLLSDTSNSKKIVELDVLFEMPGYQILVSRCFLPKEVGLG